jgi:Pyruvate/2-oxoacid:ferredoxin oxidoreductase delta subunit
MMNYDQLIIYYFSGTGNAKNASKWIIKVAEEQGINSRLINIDRFEEIEVPDLTSQTLIGFCSPTHGFNMPPIVLRFIRKFPRVKDTDAFILNTRAGMKLHKLFLPGLSGLAQIWTAFILSLKGFRIVGMQPLDLPSNWLILHPALREKVVNSIYKRCHRIVDDFALRMLGGKRKYKALLSLPFDIALIPISLGYYLVVRFFLAKTLVATDACDNCEKCMNQCPVEAIKMISNRPFWSYHCESCMRCVHSCHVEAIETVHSFSTLLILISSLVISPLLIALLDRLGVWGWINQSLITENIWSLIYAFIFLLFVFISYRGLHFLMRYRFVNRIIAYTSLSKYRFWRRYKAPRAYPPE